MKFKLSSFNSERLSRSAFLTIFTRLFSMFGFFIEYRLYSHFFGLWGFSAYSSIRRFNDTFSPLATMCWGRSIIRFVSMASYSRRFIFWILACGFFILVMGTMTVISLMNQIPEVFFVDIQMKILGALKWPVAIFLFASGTYSIVYSFYWSLFKPASANIFSVLAINVAPISAILIGGFISFNVSIYLSAVFILLVSGFAVLKTLRRIDHNFKVGQKVGSSLTRLFMFGASRTPGVFLNGVIGLFPIIDLARSYGFKEVGYFNALAALSQSSTIVTEAVGLVLLPKLSKNMSTSPELNKPYLSDLFGLFLFCGPLGMLCFYSWAPKLAELWLSPTILEGQFAAGIMCFGVPAAILYSIFRNVIDVQSFHPWNLFVSVLALNVYFLCQRVSDSGPASIAIAWAVARLVQGFGVLIISYSISRFKILLGEVLFAGGFCGAGFLLLSISGPSSSLLIIPLTALTWLLALNYWVKPGWLRIAI